MLKIGFFAYFFIGIVILFLEADIDGTDRKFYLKGLIFDMEN